MKKRAPKVGSIAYYIEEVAKYGSERKIDGTAYEGYPPVVPEMLLSLLMEVRSLFGLFRGLLSFLLGALVLGLLKALFHF